MSQTYDPGPLDQVAMLPADDRWTLVMTRQINHPVARVWAALCDPDQLSVWSPFTASRPLHELGDVELSMIPDDTPLKGRVLTVQAPHLLEYTWDVDVLRWELSETDNGTSLTLRHTVDERGQVSRMSAGWHLCLNAAEAMLAGQPHGPVQGPNAIDHGWDDLNKRYDEVLGD